MQGGKLNAKKFEVRNVFSTEIFATRSLIDLHKNVIIFFSEGLPFY